MTILFFFHLFLLIGQQKKIDSLKIELGKASIEKKAKIYNEIAYESFLIGKPDECILIGNKALKISQENKLKDQEAIAYKYIAIGETYSGKENQAFETYQKAINIFDETENFEQIARIYNNISQIYLQHGNLAEVHRYLNMALELREEHDIPDVTLFGSLGNLYQLLGMYDKSLKYNLESINLAEEINDIEGLAFGYNGLGLIYQIRNELNKSKESYQKGLSIFENLERKRHIASLNNNLGDICVLTGQFDSAFYYFNKSLKIKKELNYNEGKIFTYLAIGDLYLKTDTLIKAINNYQKAIKTAKDINALYLLSLSYNKLAVGYLKLNKNIMAKDLFVESNKLAENNKSLELINSNYYYLAKIDSTNGNFKSAFYNFYKHKSAKDSMFTKEKSKQITEMQIRYETEKKEQQISFLSKQNHNQKITNIIITIALVLSFLTILLLYSRFKMRRKVLRAKKLQAEAKLEEQKAIQRQQELESKLKLEEEQRK